MGPLPIGGTALRVEVIPTDLRNGNSGGGVQIQGHCLKGLANVLTVLPGVALMQNSAPAT